jgi:uncharacterized protein involved in exopolysaccharide biosynthesis
MFNSDQAGSKAARVQLPVPVPAARPQATVSYDPRPMVGRPSFEFGLFDIINAVWKRKWLVLLVPVLASVAAGFFARTLPNTYDSTAQILIDPRELRVLDKDVVPQGFASDASASYLETQARIITSTNMLRHIVEEQKLVEDTEFVAPPSAFDRWLGVADVPMDHTLAAAATLAKKLAVRRGEKTFVIDITLQTESPEKSAKLANAFVAAYLADQLDARGAVARRTSSSLSGRLEELQTKVRDAEDKVEAYRRLHNIVDANGKRVSEEQLAAVNGQLSAARSRLTDTRAKLDLIDKVSTAAASSNLPEAVNSPTLGILRQQLGDAERRAANLSITLGNRHPDYLSAIAVKQDAERAVRDEIGRIKAAAKVEFQRATANEADLSRQMETLKNATLDTGVDAVKLRELQRAVEASRAIYQSFLQRSLETGEQAGIDSTNTRVITEAVPPLEKSGPNRKLLIALAGLMTLGLMAGLAVLFELLSKFRAFRKETTMTAVAETSLATRPLAVLPPNGSWQDPVEPPFVPQSYAMPQSWSRYRRHEELEPEQETYTELVRIMRKIEEIERTLGLQQMRGAA